MKILLINCYHYQRGGAERAYFDMAKILEKAGHEVAFFSMAHPQNKPTKWSEYFIDEIDYTNEDLNFLHKLRLAGKIIYNFDAKDKLEKLISEFRPDVAHLHNIYHQLSPSILYALKKYDVPTVMTLHDYKIISPNYSLFHNGKIWEKRSGWQLIKDRVIKGSYLKSLICVIEKNIHSLLGSYEKVDISISPSRFLKNKFRQYGFKGKIEHLPNYLEFKNSNVDSHNNFSSQPILFYGRLSPEKGVSVLIEAISKLKNKPTVWIVGSGPEEKKLKNMVKKLNLDYHIRFRGSLFGDDLEKAIAGAKAVVIPSIWYENMPYTLLESMARGKAILASNIGGISEWIEDGKSGMLFSPGNSIELAKKIDSLNKSDLISLGINARKTVEKISNEKEYTQRLVEIYQNLINNKNKKMTIHRHSYGQKITDIIFISVFLMLALILLFFRSVQLTDKLIYEEQTGYVQKIKSINNDLDSAFSDIEQAVENKQANAYGVIYLSANEKNNLSNSQRIIEEKIYKLDEQRLAYNNDFSIKYYPRKSTITDELFVRAMGLHVAAQRLVRSMDMLVYSTTTSKDQLEIARQNVWSLRWHINNIKSSD